MRSLLTLLFVILSAVPAGAEAIEAAAHGASDHGNASSGLPQFDPSMFPSQIFWLAVIFGVLYLVFSRGTIPAISAGLAKRHGHIAKDRDAASVLAAEARDVRSAYEQSVAQARTQAISLRTETETALRTLAQTKLQGFQVMADSKVRETEARIAHNRDVILAELPAIAADVSSEAVALIVGGTPDLERARKVVDALTLPARAA